MEGIGNIQTELLEINNGLCIRVLQKNRIDRGCRWINEWMHKQTNKQIFLGNGLCDCGGWQVKWSGQARSLEILAGVDIEVVTPKAIWR